MMRQANLDGERESKIRHLARVLDAPTQECKVRPAAKKAGNLVVFKNTEIKTKIKV